VPTLHRIEFLDLRSDLKCSLLCLRKTSLYLLRTLHLRLSHEWTDLVLLQHADSAGILLHSHQPFYLLSEHRDGLIFLVQLLLHKSHLIDIVIYLKALIIGFCIFYLNIRITIAVV
jgi:hypothetical protein